MFIIMRMSGSRVYFLLFSALASGCGGRAAREPAPPAGLSPSPEKAPASPEKYIPVSVSGVVDGAQVVEGRRSSVTLTVKNRSDDLVVVSAIVTDRAADGTLDFLRSAYGHIGEAEGGRLVFNMMAQMATPGVFFDKGALIQPGGEASYRMTTRFFDKGRAFTARYYRIQPAEMSAFIFVPEAQGAGAGGMSGVEKTFVPSGKIEELPGEAGGFVLWNRGKLKELETGCSLTPQVGKAPFSMQEALEKIKTDADIAEVSYSDTFDAWIVQSCKGGTWLVRRSGLERFTGVDSEVFEKIDEKDGKDIRFKVREEWFKGKVKLEDGDGMYTVGKFLTASGEDILDVLRVVTAQQLFTCRVTYYFFDAWYIDFESVVPDYM
jgi:hypothetical protein